MPNKRARRLAFAARRAETRGGYMGHVLTQYCQQEQISEADLVESLAMTREGHTRLMLCKAPDPQVPDYEQRVARIAAYVGVSKSRLTRVLKNRR